MLKQTRQLITIRHKPSMRWTHQSRRSGALRCFGWPGPERAEQAVLARRRGEGSDQVCARFL